MAKELDIGKTFDKLDQKNPDDIVKDLKQGKLKVLPEGKMSNRDRIMTDMLLQAQYT